MALNLPGVHEFVVSSLAELVRIYTILMYEVELCASRQLVLAFPVCRLYVYKRLADRADNLRSLFRYGVKESGPVYRQIRCEALAL